MGAVYTQIFGGSPVTPSLVSYTAITLSANTTLAWPIQFQNTSQVVSNIMDVTPTAGGFTLTLPPANQVSLGQSFIINNLSGANAFTLATNAGLTTFNIALGTSYYFYLINNTTHPLDGTWRQTPFAAGAPAVTSVNAVANGSTSGNLVLSGVPIVSAGTIGFDFANDLLALTGFGAATGYAIRTAANTWALRSFTVTANQLTVTNPSGAAGATNFGLAANITGINSFQSGNLQLAGNVLSNFAGGPITITPSGGQNINLSNPTVLATATPLIFTGTNGINTLTLEPGNITANATYILPTVPPVLTQVLAISNIVGSTYSMAWASVPVIGGASTPNALPYFTNNQSSLSSTAILAQNIIGVGITDLSGITSAIIGNLQIGISGGVAAANSITAQNANGSITLAPNGNGRVNSTSDIVIEDGNSLFLLEVGNPSTANFVTIGAPALAQNYDYFWPTKNQATSTATSAYMGILAGTNAGTTSFLQFIDSSPSPNILINGAFQISQRGSSFTNASYYPNNNNVYTLDAWKLYSNGNNIVNVSNFIVGNGVKFTVTTANTKFGYAQILPFIVTFPVTGYILSYSMEISANGISSIGSAVIAWNGAADQPTSNFVTAWNAQGVNPTLAAGWQYVGTPKYFNVGVSTTIYSTTLTSMVPTSSNNLAFFFWCDNTNAAVNSTLIVLYAKLEMGQNITLFSPRDVETELNACKYIYQSDFGMGGTPGTTLDQSSSGTLMVDPTGAGATIPTTNTYGTVKYEVEMRIAPTIVVYPYTTVSNTGRVSNNTGTDLAANSGTVGFSDTQGFTLKNTSGGNITTTSYFLFHYTADAGFNL